MSKKCRLAVVIALTAYIVKNLFVGADTDEGYGIVLGYRLAMGDRLLLEMWEPHQTSAIFTALLIKPYLSIVGGVTFLNIYLRAVYFLIHGAITFFIYHTFRTCVFQGEKREALWLALVFFVSSPKCIYIPEYSNLHIWFFSLLCLSIFWFVSAQSPLRGKRWIVFAAGVFLTCDVLAYPSMVILFPIFLVLLWRKSSRKSDCFIFTAPCLLGAAILCGYILSYMTVDEISKVIPHILDDGSHRAGIWEKSLDWAASFGEIALIMLFTGLAAGILTAVYCRFSRNKKAASVCFLILFYLLQTGYQFYCWFTSEFNASYPHILYCFILLSGIYCFRRSNRRDKDSFYLILVSFAGYFGVMLLSNWAPIHLMPYLILGVLGGLVCWHRYFSEQAVVWKEKALPVLCGILVFSNVFGYCWLYIGGEWIHSNILTVGGINSEGMRKGIFTSYMSAFHYNADQTVWREAVPEGSTCLYIGPSQFYYLFGDCRIAAASTISTPVYDENLLEYWDIHPDRYPDVVVVESWFGDMRGAGGGTFIRQWLEEEFQASQVTEYSYVTVFRK